MRGIFGDVFPFPFSLRQHIVGVYYKFRAHRIPIMFKIKDQYCHRLKIISASFRWNMKWLVWFGLVSLFNSISTLEGYFVPKPSTVKNNSDTNLGDKEVHAFSKGIGPKVNVITSRLQSSTLVIMPQKLFSQHEMRMRNIHRFTSLKKTF